MRSMTFVIKLIVAVVIAWAVSRVTPLATKAKLVWFSATQPCAFLYGTMFCLFLWRDLCNMYML